MTTHPRPRPKKRIVAAAAAVCCVAGLAVPAAAELKGKLAGWKATAEVSYVLTGGNQSTSAFSLGTNFTRSWEKDTLLFKTYILRSNSTTVTRTAVGTELDFDLVEEKTRTLIAENYLLTGQYDRKISKRFLFQTSLSWDRNKFAGIDSRFLLTAGAGYSLVETDKTKFKTNAGMTYTLRKFLRQDSTSFAGFRFDVLFNQQISASASFASQFVFDDNLKKMSDWRYDWTNSLTASINKSLALKTSLRLLYAHLPPDQAIPLFEPGGVPTGLNVLVPLKNLDTFFTTSVVINF
jgi:putative salt-induced outer membrane protein YdiY